MPDTDIIREARELCERATPGKWYSFGGWMIHTEPDADNRGILPEQTIGTVRTQNAAFIARSRTLIPELLDLLAAKDAEIARLTLEVVKWRACSNENFTTCNRLTVERDAIKQSCDGLCVSHDNVYARLTDMTARAEKAEVERDAAIADIANSCETCCKNNRRDNCFEMVDSRCVNWAWRGAEG